MGANFFYFLFLTNTPRSHAMLPALDAVLSHRSAHFFATGPMRAEPSVSPSLFTMTAA